MTDKNLTLYKSDRAPIKLLTKEEFRVILKCKSATINHLVSSRQIPFLMIGKEVRFRLDSIEKWLEAREKKASFDLTDGI